jgi:L-alanine-DL-glutamate epimerase-like enolase superfamily enzyme
MEITDVRTILLGYEKRDPPMGRGFALIRLETDGGVVGFGETTTNYGHSYPTVVRTIVDDILKRRLVGSDPLDIRARLDEMHLWLDGYLGWDGVTAQVVGGVEIALWDILGKTVEQPIWRVLGGSRKSLPLYGTGTTAFERSPEWHAHYFDEAFERGIKAIKVRLGNDPRADEALVAGVRSIVGPEIEIAVDAYWAYPPDAAIRLAQRIAQYDVLFFEEPVPQPLLNGLARVREASPIPIAVGERVFTASSYQLVAEKRAADIFEPDVTLAGGFLEGLAIADLAKAHGLTVIPHVGGSTAVGIAANAHFAACIDCPLVEYDIDPYQPLRDEILREPILAMNRLDDGRLSVPDGPGLGIEIEEEAFARFPYRSGKEYAEIYPEHAAGRLAG